MCGQPFILAENQAAKATSSFLLGLKVRELPPRFSQNKMALSWVSFIPTASVYAAVELMQTCNSRNMCFIYLRRPSHPPPPM